MKLLIDKELRTHIRAQYPIIYLVTYEESRTEYILHNICLEAKMDMYSWSFTSGLEQIGKPEPPTQMNPLKVFDYASEVSTPSLFVLKDLHSFFGNQEVVRKIRDWYNQAHKVYKPIIITSPVLKIPVELEKIITVLDLQLPGADEIEDLLNVAIETIKAKTNFEDLSDAEMSSVVRACMGLTSDEIENVLAKTWIENGTFDVSSILAEKKQIVRKSGILEYFDELENYNNVGGMDALKTWLEERGDVFGDDARKAGLPFPKGVLLLGIPGVGKTLLAKAVSNLWGLPLIKMDVGKVFAGIVGASEQNMRKAIATVEACAPAILMIDEIEKGLSGVGSSNFSDAGTAARVFGTFLQWLNDKTSPVFVIATANDVTQLPPELLRKGRFDEIFFVSLPDHEDRKEIFQIHVTKPRGQHPGRTLEGFDLDELASLTEGFSGSEIEQVVIAGLFKAFKEKKELAQEHLVSAINETIPLSLTMEEQITRLKRWAHNRARPASSRCKSEEQPKLMEMPKIRITRKKGSGGFEL